MLTFKQLVNSYKHLLCKRQNYKECKHKHKWAEDKVPSSNKQSLWGIKQKPWETVVSSTHHYELSVSMVAGHCALTYKVNTVQPLPARAAGPGLFGRAGLGNTNQGF